MRIGLLSVFLVSFCCATLVTCAIEQSAYGEQEALLNELIDKLIAADLGQYVLYGSDGSKTVNFKGLVDDVRARPVVFEFLQNVGYPLSDGDAQLGAAIMKRRSKRATIADFFSSLFKPLLDSFQQNVQASFQDLLSNSVKDIINIVQGSLFNGKPLNFNDLAGQFIERLKDTAKKTIVNTVKDSLQQQALTILDNQIVQLNKLLDRLKGNSIGFNEFMSQLQNVLGGLQGQLKTFIPTISDIIAQQLDALLTQLINSIKIKI